MGDSTNLYSSPTPPNSPPGIMLAEPITALIRNIVSAEMPDELPSFDFEGANIVREFVASGGEIRPHTKGGAVGEADRFASAMDVLEFVKLVVGTVTALVQLVQALKPTTQPAEKEVVTMWRSKLIKAGLREDKADRIATRFYREALGAIGRKS